MGDKDAPGEKGNSDARRIVLKTTDRPPRDRTFDIRAAARLCPPITYRTWVP